MLKWGTGFTLVDVLVGISLMLIVFLGIFGAYSLGLKVVDQSKNKIIATAIANEQLEKIRNLSYESVGTKNAALPRAKGVLDSATTTIRNGVEYTVNIYVKYILDDADGTSIETGDSCYLDYKRAEIKVSWPGVFGGEVKLLTDAAPKNKTEEVNSCTTQPGGILSVSVFNAYGEMVVSPLIKVFNLETGEEFDYPPIDGKHDFALVTSTYRVVVSKSGYSSEQTFGSGEAYSGQTVITPEKPHPIVLKGQLTELSLSIDQVSSFMVATLSPWGVGVFSDSFLDATKISELVDLSVGSGEVKLATTSDGYLLSGYLLSTSTTPQNLVNWKEFSWSDSEPSGTDIKYQVFYASTTGWLLIPDSDLTGNSSGFDLPPVNLSSLNPAVYPQLKLKANFSTIATSSSPVLYDWNTSWINSVATPILNANFQLQGAKIIGYDATDKPIYKYSLSTSSDAYGQRNISNLEWDSYTFSVLPASGLDLISTEPSPQPINLSPATSSPVNLYLDAENSFLLTLEDTITGALIFSAEARLYNLFLGYDKLQYTNEIGQTYFIPLTADDYNLDIQAPGYLATSTSISVSGDVTKVIKLEQIE